MSGDIRDMTAENRRIFGHQHFRSGQEEIIRNAIQGRDVFVAVHRRRGLVQLTDLHKRRRVAYIRLEVMIQDVLYWHFQKYIK